MIGQITPLVKVAGRRVWCAAIAAHAVGGVASAGLLGLSLGVCGVALMVRRWGPLPVILVSALLVLRALHEAEILAPYQPSLQRQTPKKFLCAFGPVWGAFAWGLDLGQGWTTRIEFTGYYALVAFALLEGSPLLGGVVMASYALGRAAPVLLAGLAAAETSSGPMAFGYVFHSQILHRINAVALALIASVFIMSALLG